MALVTVNDLPVSSVRICLPRRGLWHADVRVETETPISGRVTLKAGALELSGTVRRGGIYLADARLRVVAGAGGLGNEVPAKSYRALPAKTPLEDILAAGGEVLAGNVDMDVLGATQAAWVTRRGSAADALNALIAWQGVVWRALPDGSLWVGKETWPEVEFDDIDVVREDPELGRALVSTLELEKVLPGNVWDGRRISYVEHSLDARGLRTWVWFEDSDA